uniref:Putative secreted protein n=1 Tax=Ixodes ricinus TaxID=34613 RepID=A0A6B0UD31_IXORI
MLLLGRVRLSRSCYPKRWFLFLFGHLSRSCLVCEECNSVAATVELFLFGFVENEIACQPKPGSRIIFFLSFLEARIIKGVLVKPVCMEGTIQ